MSDHPKGQHGGARPNSGPPKQAVEKLPATAGQEPLEFLLAVQNDANADPRLRIQAAKAAAALMAGGRSSLQDRKRIRLGQGEGDKFAASAPPKLKVVGR